MLRICKVCGQAKGDFWNANIPVCSQCGDEFRKRFYDVYDDGGICNTDHVTRQMFRERNGDHKYLLRDIPKDILYRCKRESEKRGIPMRELILLAMDWISRESLIL